MRRGTNDFDIAYHHAENLLIVRILELRSEDVWQQFEDAFQQTIREIRANAPDWHLLLDVSQISGLPQEVQDLLVQTLLFAHQSGMRKKAILAKGTIPFPIHPLEHDPAFKVHFYFQSEADAVRWLVNA